MDIFFLIGLAVSIPFIIRALKEGGVGEFGKFDEIPKPSPPRHEFYYHGTKKPVALEIWKTGLWLGGKSEPRGVYFVRDLKIAKEYCGEDGAIVAVKLGPSVDLKMKYEGVYYFPLPDDEKPYEKYYQIPGIIPIGVISPEGEQIA
jgi:hypothetical protein